MSKLKCLAVGAIALILGPAQVASADYIITARVLWIHANDVGPEQLLLDTAELGSCAFEGKFIASVPETDTKETMVSLAMAAMLAGKLIRVKTTETCTLVYVRLIN